MMGSSRFCDSTAREDDTSSDRLALPSSGLPVTDDSDSLSGESGHTVRAFSVCRVRSCVPCAVVCVRVYL